MQAEHRYEGGMDHLAVADRTSHQPSKNGRKDRRLVVMLQLHSRTQTVLADRQTEETSVKYLACVVMAKTTYTNIKSANLATRI